MNESPKKSAPHRPRFALETEVIWAVIGLYIFIMGLLLLIHHLQPEGTATHTSSPSPSHASHYDVPGGQSHAVRPTADQEP
ncbi:MAG: hypothetical protein ACOYOL_00180 [Chthoniobacterales bacterium]|jgi:hypothetical protein